MQVVSCRLSRIFYLLHPLGLLTDFQRNNSDLRSQDTRSETTTFRQQLIDIILDEHNEQNLHK